MLQKIISLFSPKKTASGVGFSPFAREKFLDIINNHGIEAHYYMPTIGMRDDEEPCEALDALSHAGYIMTDKKGNIVGKVAKARPSADEIAAERRTEFKIIE